MAPETTKPKRKRNVTGSDKKVQFADEAAARPSKKAKTASIPEGKPPAVKPKENRKRAADFFDDAAEKLVEKPVKIKKAKVSAETDETLKKSKKVKINKNEEEKPKKTKKIKTAPVVDEDTVEALPTSISKAKTKMEANGKKSKAVVARETIFDDSSENEDQINIADQTAALLAGFDSNSDESDHGEDMPVNHVPEAKLSKKERKALAAAQSDTPGTIYVGRVPHGFFEHQMKAYFSQFGDVIRLRLSRNKKGASRHYAFIEFSSGEVADIVAKTMNNYLMFGHILKVRRVPDEQLHPDLWKGAGKRFKVVPRARMHGRELALPKGREYWRMKVEQEEERRKEKATILKELGYEFEMPVLRRVEDVPMRDEVIADDKTPKAIEATAATVEDPVENEILKVVETVVSQEPEKITVTETEKTLVTVKKMKKSKKTVA